MLNQLILVGRLNDINENGTLIELINPRSYKNEDGEHKSNTFIINVPEKIANLVKENCKVGDLIGIKGRIEEEIGITEIFAEKLTFLSGKKKEDD